MNEEILSSSKPERRYDIDWLRIIAVFMVLKKEKKGRIRLTKNQICHIVLLQKQVYREL